MERVILVIKLKLRICLVIIILVIKLRAKELVNLKYKLTEVKIIKS